MKNGKVNEQIVAHCELVKKLTCLEVAVPLRELLTKSRSRSLKEREAIGHGLRSCNAEQRYATDVKASDDVNARIGILRRDLAVTDATIMDATSALDLLNQLTVCRGVAMGLASRINAALVPLKKTKPKYKTVKIAPRTATFRVG